MKTSNAQQLITARRNGVPSIPTPPPVQSSSDLKPVMLEIEEMLAQSNRSLTEQLSQATKVFQQRGGEASLTKALVIRRDEVVVQWDIKLSTD